MKKTNFTRKRYHTNENSLENINVPALEKVKVFCSIYATIIVHKHFLYLFIRTDLVTIDYKIANASFWLCVLRQPDAFNFKVFKLIFRHF